MDDNTISPERSSQLKALEIHVMFKVRGFTAEKCYALAKERIVSKEITNRQFNWLAGQGCLGHELKEKAKLMWATNAIQQLNLLPNKDGKN